MATLPADRTKLALAQSNQNPSNVLGSSQNKNAITEAYDTIDLLYNNMTGLISAAQLSKLGIINVKDYNASGSAQTTTGSITSGSNVLTLSSAIDFANGQGIYIYGKAEVDSLQITAAATVSSNVTVTLNGVAFLVAVVAGDTIAQVATKIRSATYTGWTTSGANDTIIFTSTTTGTRTTPVYSAGTTTATGTMTITTQGSADLITSVVSGAGTTTLTLASNATTTVSGVTIAHDDTEAFRQVMRSYTAYASITTGRKIYAPSGNYSISGTLYLRKGDILLGAGGTSTVLLNATANTTVKMGIGLINGVETADSGGLEPVVEGIFFQGSSTATGIYTNVNGWKIKDCWFVCQVGIDANGTDGLITNCMCDGGNHFIVINGDGAAYGATHSIIVSNCRIYAPSYAGMRIEGASNIIISDCYFDYGKFYSIYSSGANANYRIKISDCHFMTSGSSSNYDATQQHIYILGGGWKDSLIDTCTFSRSRSGDIDLETANIDGLKINNCKFIDSNGPSIKANGGSNIKITSSEWRNTFSYPIDALTKIIVDDCTFLNPHSGGIPVNDYDKGCIRLQQAASADSVISDNVTDSTTVAVLAVRSNSTNVYSNGNKGKWNVDAYFYTTNPHTSLNERSSQVGADHIIVKGMANQRTFMGTAVPTTGTFNATDRMVNTAPAVGSPKAWTCTVAGTPGTWVSEGNL